MFLRDVQKHSTERSFQKSCGVFPKGPFTSFHCVRSPENKIFCQQYFTNNLFKANIFSSAELDAAMYKLIQGGDEAALPVRLQALLPFVQVTGTQLRQTADSFACGIADNSVSST